MPPIRCFLGGIDDFVRETDASSPRKRWTQGCRNAERALLLCVGVNVPRASVDNCSTWTAFMRLNRLTLERLPVLVFLQTMELSDAGFCCRIAYGLPFRFPASCAYFGDHAHVLRCQSPRTLRRTMHLWSVFSMYLCLFDTTTVSFAFAAAALKDFCVLLC
jgi:hypothetical protein